MEWLTAACSKQPLRITGRSKKQGQAGLELECSKAVSSNGRLGECFPLAHGKDFNSWDNFTLLPGAQTRTCRAVMASLDGSALFQAVEKDQDRKQRSCVTALEEETMTLPT